MQRECVGGDGSRGADHGAARPGVLRLLTDSGGDRPAGGVAGVYDNDGFALRGTQVTDADGSHTLTTVIPGLYPSRTEHIHVKVTGPDGMVRTTQLCFPGVPQNDSDGIFSESMLVTVTAQSGYGMAATFDFVLP